MASGFCLSLLGRQLNPLGRVGSKGALGRPPDDRSLGPGHAAQISQSSRLHGARGGGVRPTSQHGLLSVWPAGRLACSLAS